MSKNRQQGSTPSVKNIRYQAIILSDHFSPGVVLKSPFFNPQLQQK